jgi:small redox-active disulfide protein 2
MKIEIYGTGCLKCKTLFENTQKALTELDLEADLSKIEDINQITSAGVMFTPAIAVDGEVKSTGKLLSTAEIKQLLT